ncbi:MAG: pyrroline-5-carboxylate reductase [Planctomycetes bacterium]|nr:pyrroline-5-carboxylate reductase [Planctomycetota bacterium]
MLRERLGFLGGGRMAEALVSGILGAKLSKPGLIRVSDVAAERLKLLRDALGVGTTASNADVVRQSDVVVLAVKPNVVAAVLGEVKDLVTAKHLVVSIAAGVPLKALEAALPTGSRVVRVMPNTPCLVGAGASVFALGRHATPADAKLVSSLLGAVGLAFQMDEKHLDAVTGLSGSGPAYVYLVIEALSDGGVKMGLPRDVATKLAAQTVFGAARMVLDTGQHPGQLKDMVASPGGTTIEGLHALERGGLRTSLMDAVEAATVKSKKLGETAK